MIWSKNRKPVGLDWFWTGPDHIYVDRSANCGLWSGWAGPLTHCFQNRKSFVCHSLIYTPTKLPQQPCSDSANGHQCACFVDFLVNMRSEVCLFTTHQHHHVLTKPLSSEASQCKEASSHHLGHSCSVFASLLGIAHSHTEPSMIRCNTEL